MNDLIMETKEIPIPEPNITRDFLASRYILILNNPQEKNISHDKIRQILLQLKSLVYFCMADDIGLQKHTLHTRVFIILRFPVRFSYIKKLFPTAYIEPACGPAEAHRDYILKSGKWANGPKTEIIVPGSFEEWGTSLKYRIKHLITRVCNKKY